MASILPWLWPFRGQKAIRKNTIDAAYGGAECEMQAGFDQEFRSLPPPQREVFDYAQARLLFEADVFWATEAIGAEELTAWLSVYQLSREMVPRGIVEVLLDDRNLGAI
jgi:hypothetical protein